MSESTERSVRPDPDPNESAMWEHLSRQETAALDSHRTLTEAGLSDDEARALLVEAENLGFARMVRESKSYTVRDDPSFYVGVRTPDGGVGAGSYCCARHLAFYVRSWQALRPSDWLAVCELTR